MKPWNAFEYMVRYNEDVIIFEMLLKKLTNNNGK